MKMDIATRVTALLDWAEANGSKVIAIEALRRALDGHQRQARHERIRKRVALRDPDPEAIGPSP